MASNIPAEKIIVALDFPTGREALALAQTLKSTGVKFKVGMELFYAEGLAILEKLRPFGDVFLDLKVHDIPETMARTASVLAQTGVWMFNVHASAGSDALLRVRDAVAQSVAKNALRAPLVIAVTVLTSLQNLSHLGTSIDTKLVTLSLAKSAHEAGLSGVVCSAQECPLIKTIGKDFLCVTPGIRRPDDTSGDQVRTATPKQALDAGSDYLVIGRPISRATDPIRALQDILVGA